MKYTNYILEGLELGEMRMICSKCNNNFKYKQVLEIVWSLSGNQNLKCQHCGQLYEIKKVSKLLLAVLIALPIFFLDYFIREIGNYYTLFYILYSSIIIVISPLIVEFNHAN